MDYVLISKDQSTALIHRDHKYIEREWKNGHWVYYYLDTYKNDKGKKRYKITGRSGKLTQTRDKNGNLLTESVQPRDKNYTKKLEYKIKENKTEFDRLRQKANQQNVEARRGSAGRRGAEKFNERKETQQKLNAVGRNYAAAMQEHGRIEQLKFKNRAKKWLKKRVSGLKKK